MHLCDFLIKPIRNSNVTISNLAVKAKAFAKFALHFTTLSLQSELKMTLNKIL